MKDALIDWALYAVILALAWMAIVQGILAVA